MNNNIHPGYEGLKIQAEALIERDQTPLLCMYLDPVSKNVYIMGESECVKEVRESRALLDLEIILKTKLELNKKLTFYDQKSEDPKVCSRSPHSCHALTPKFQFSWEKDPPACFDDTTTVDVSYDDLPKEILCTVLSFLEPSDLKNVSLVSKRWKSVADKRALWTGFQLPRKCREKKVNFVKFFELSISSKLQNLVLSNLGFQLNDGHLENVMNLELTLQEIEIGEIDLSNISEEPLAKLVNTCKECSIIDTKHSLKLNQVEAIFRRLRPGTKLKSLFIASVDLSLVSPSLLANALNWLESLKLFKIKLIPKQLKTIFDTMKVRSNLKVLWLDSMDLESVGLEIFNLTLGTLTELSFNDTNLNNEQVNGVLEILDKSSKLKLLDLGLVDLQGVPAELLARVLNTVEHVILEASSVQAHQLKEILLTISQGISAIRKLDLEDVEVVKDIDPEILAKSVNKLKIVYLGGSGEPSENQLQVIFKEMSLETNLNNLAVEEFQHIEKVDPETLAKALNNMKSVKLFGECNLTLAQYVAFFKQLNIKTKLKTIERYQDDGSWLKYNL